MFLYCIQVFLRLYFLFLSFQVFEIAPHVIDLLFVLKDGVREFFAGY